LKWTQFGFRHPITLFVTFSCRKYRFYCSLTSRSNIARSRSIPKVLSLRGIPERTKMEKMIHLGFKGRNKLGKEAGILEVGQHLIGKAICLHWAGYLPDATRVSSKFESAGRRQLK
jgi:hypothetical protein